jgi:hypothetical protein
MLLQYASIQSFELFTFQTVGSLLCIQTFVIDGLTIGQDRTNSMPPSHLKDGGDITIFVDNHPKNIRPTRVFKSIWN